MNDLEAFNFHNREYKLDLRAIWRRGGISVNSNLSLEKFETCSPYILLHLSCSMEERNLDGFETSQGCVNDAFLFLCFKSKPTTGVIHLVSDMFTVTLI